MEIPAFVSINLMEVLKASPTIYFILFIDFIFYFIFIIINYFL